MGVTDELALRREAAIGEGGDGDETEEPTAVGETGEGAGGEGAGEGAAEGEGGEGDGATGEIEVVPEPKPTPPMQIALPGDWDAIGSEFGGRAPDTSEIRLLGGSMRIKGSFAKGTVMDLLVRVKVTEVAGIDRVDAWGQEQDTVRRHRARMIEVKRLNMPSSAPTEPSGS